MRGWKASAWAEYAREPSDPGNPIRQQLPRTWNEKSHVPPSPPRFLSILARISHFRDHPHPANSNFLIARQIFYRVSAVAPSLNVFEEIKSHGNISKFSSANRECETLWKMKELIEEVILTVG